MGFILDGLNSESYDRQYNDRELIKRILAYFKPFAWKMTAVAGLIFVTSVVDTAQNIILAQFLDRLSVDPNIQAIINIALITLGIALFSWIGNYFRRWLSSQVVGDVVLKVREDTFDAVVRHDLSFFDEQSSGKVVSRITSDTQAFSNVVTLTLDLLSQLLLVVILLGWLATINWQLTLMLVGIAPVAILIALSFRKIARNITQQSRRINATINAQIQESISGIVVAKSFRQERSIYANFADNNEQSYRIALRRSFTFDSIFPVLNLASGAANAFFIYASGLATRTSISAGSWFLFMRAVGYFWWPMISIASFWSQFQDGLSAAERVFALIDLEPKVIQKGDEPVGDMKGHIIFKDMRFSYNDGEVILPRFNLDIQPGETIALVGHTGAGKSSVARLISRFYEFQEGNLLVDGRDIRSLDLRQLRQHIGIVPQEPFLFSGTVRDNIAFGLSDASDAAVENAARMVSGGDWLLDLPEGLDTDVGERGANLSMGQRQLVALARVLLKNPEVFILDEATASVDPFTETQIQEGLDAIMRDRTAIVIAHRLSTIRHADRIIVMSGGEIIEEGNHDGLMNAGGHYAELYNTYFRHQSLEYIEQFQAEAGD